LTCKAPVYQKIGENWVDVALTLATGNPNYNGVKPILASQYLNFGQKNHTNRKLKKNKVTIPK